MDKDKMKKLVKQLCLIGIIFSNIGLLMSCVIVSVSILGGNKEMIIFSVEIFFFFIFTLHFSNYFSHYLE